MTVLPVADGGRPIGAWVVGPDGAAFRPVVDLTLLGGAALAAAGAATVAIAVAVAAGRRRPDIGTVTMGPGGWVSVKRTALPPLRSGAPRPWWARALRTRRLVPQP
ncbi:hypothetical protein GCM10020358_09220 [Amorphoplanes nipponensis]|uniref:hypothetical protein n=1 Tax=Actinoplanes nipponensis TaxID=135950 RepID=UPI0031EA4FA3